MIRFQIDPSVDIADRSLRVISQIEIVGDTYGSTLMLTGSKRPAAIVLRKQGQEAVLPIPDEHVDASALHAFIKSNLNLTI